MATRAMPEDPSPDDQEWLLDGLASLIREVGPHPFVANPLVTDDRAYFPDRADNGPARLQVTARRLLTYAGRDQARAVVLDLRSRSRGDAGSHLTMSDVRFTEVNGNEFVFALEALGNDDVLGHLCHQVGVACWLSLNATREVHPYRSEEATPVEARGSLVEQQMGSLAAMYLGFGVLATNAAHTSMHAGDFYTTSWAIQQSGGLPSQALAFVLAVQAEVRAGDTDAYDALLPNQRADFDAWRAALRGRCDELIDRLGLPPPTAWPARDDGPPRPFEDETYARREDLERLAQFNRGRKTYRVRATKRTPYGVLGLALGAAAAIPLAVHVGPAAIACVVFGALVGGQVGARNRADFCADPACEEPLALELAECPRCGGTIAGEISHQNDRLDADDDG